MERRHLLRLSAAAAGMALVGNRVEEVSAAGAAAKALPTAYEGTFTNEVFGDTWRLQFGAHLGRVSGTLAFDGTVLRVRGTLRKGKLKAEGVFDPNDGNVAVTISGKVKGALIRGRVESVQVALRGDFALKKWAVDRPAMRQQTGNYEGIVSQGPGFTGKCQVYADGRLRLFDVIKPGGEPIKGQIPGYYVIKKESADSAVAGGGVVALVFFLVNICSGELCDCDKPSAAEVEFAEQKTTFFLQSQQSQFDPSWGDWEIAAGRDRA